MKYVMSDLHGCYDKYLQMIDKIELNSDDALYILGDVIDRGNDGISILSDMMKRSNIVPVLGNHEYMAYNLFKRFNVEITAENYNKHLCAEDIKIFENWMFNGGVTTLQSFSALNKEEKQRIIEYFEEFSLYEEVEASGNKFILVHGGIANFDFNKSLHEYHIRDFIWGRCDYSKQYYPDKFLVTGHTPTNNINKEYKGRIYQNNNHIAIDCGAVFGGKLGCICLDTLEEFYV